MGNQLDGDDKMEMIINHKDYVGIASMSLDRRVQFRVGTDWKIKPVRMRRGHDIQFSEWFQDTYLVLPTFLLISFSGGYIEEV